MREISMLEFPGSARAGWTYKTLENKLALKTQIVITTQTKLIKLKK